tara:strand:- start:1591 stop:2022 length:432 start_codon:yes stop_codon:yes gene_type:complete
MTESKKIEMIKSHLNINITHDANQWENADLRVYKETTADDYEIFVVTSEVNPSITEDVHYYDSDLAESIMEEVESFFDNLQPDVMKDFYTENMNIYIEEELYDDIYMNDTLMSWLEDNVEAIIENSEELSLTDDEVTYLEETY